jgi:hypothetical protein
LSIWHYQFRDFYVHEDGGAFCSNYSAGVFNVIFQNCTAQEAAAFYCTGAVHSVYSTFKRCRGRLGAGFAMIPTNAKPLSLEYSLFEQLETDSDCGFVVKGGGPVRLNSTNFRRIKAENYVGGFESFGSELTMKSCILTRTNAGISNGGIACQTEQVAAIEHTNFQRCGHRSDDGLTAAALFVKEGGNGNIVRECVSFKCEISGGHTISFKTGSSINIENCCFTETKNEAILGGNWR